MNDANNIIFDYPECRQGIKAPANFAVEMGVCHNCKKSVKAPGAVSKNEVVKPPLSLQHLSREKFIFLPLQDFTNFWTDKKLCKKYGITKDEITLIESMARTMEANNSEREASR